MYISFSRSYFCYYTFLKILFYSFFYSFFFLSSDLFFTKYIFFKYLHDFVSLTRRLYFVKNLGNSSCRIVQKVQRNKRKTELEIHEYSLHSRFYLMSRRRKRWLDTQRFAFFIRVLCASLFSVSYALIVAFHFPPESSWSGQPSIHGKPLSSSPSPPLSSASRFSNARRGYQSLLVNRDARSA